MKNLVFILYCILTSQFVSARNTSFDNSQKIQKNYLNSLMVYKKNTPTIKINFSTKSISSQVGFSYSIQLPLNSQNSKFLLNFNSKKERFINGLASNQSRFQNIELNPDEIISKNNAIFVKWKL